MTSRQKYIIAHVCAVLFCFIEITWMLSYPWRSWHSDFVSEGWSTTVASGSIYLTHREAAGRYPHELWRTMQRERWESIPPGWYNSPTPHGKRILGFGFFSGHYNGSTTYSRMTIVAIPWWPLALATLVPALLWLPRSRWSWWRRRERRGFEPILAAPPARRDTIDKRG